MTSTATSPFVRARAHAAAIPGAISGHHGHDRTFVLACALVNGFALDEGDALTILREWNTACQPPWDEHELVHKVQSAAAATHDNPRGHLLGQSCSDSQRFALPSSALRIIVKRPLSASRVRYDEAKLRALTAKLPGVTGEWLWERSPIRPDCMSPGAFLLRLYRPGERIHVFTRFNAKASDASIQITEPPFDCRILKRFQTGQQNVWFLCNPVDGEWHLNPRDGGKLSCRSKEAVTAFRFAVLESDDAPPDLWLSALAQLPIRIAAIYTSGGRSIHALWQVDATTKAEWDSTVAPRKAALKVLGADPGALSAVRLSRLPQCERLEKGGFQKLLYLNPNPPKAPLADMPIRETRAAMMERLKDCELAEDSGGLDYIPPTDPNEPF